MITQKKLQHVAAIFGCLCAHARILVCERERYTRLKTSIARLNVEPNFRSILTLLAAPKNREGLDSAMGLNANDEELMSSKKFLLLSEDSVIKVELLLLLPGAKGIFPVVGDG